VEQIDGTYYTFDTTNCALIFKKFEVENDDEDDMKSDVVLIASTASLGIQNAIAKGTPYDPGYSHGCSDAKLTFPERYIN
jgi:hypothetical protein